MSKLSVFSRVSIFALVVSGLAAAPAAHAQNIVNYAVALTGTSPSFNRPLTTTTLSAVGTNVYYQSQLFTVNTTATYSLQTTAAALTGTSATDTFLALYQTSFNPASPLTNILAVNDDDSTNPVSTSLSLISRSLTAGTQYYLVTTTYYNQATGTINSRITGPAGSTVSLGGVTVPETGTFALALPALAMVGTVILRRRKK